MTCEFCGNEHGKICPSVRAIEYHANGKVKRVEFMRQVDYHPMQQWIYDPKPITIGPISAPWPTTTCGNS